MDPNPPDSAVRSSTARAFRGLPAFAFPFAYAFSLAGPAGAAVIDLRTPGANPALEDLQEAAAPAFFITNRLAPVGGVALDLPVSDGPVADPSPAAGSEDASAGAEEKPAPANGAADFREKARAAGMDETIVRFLEVKLRRAKLHLSMNDLEGARLICQEILNADPLNAEAYLVRGAVEAKRNRHTHALEDFDRAIKADPESAEARLSRGISLLRIGRLERALEDLDAAVRLDPDLAEAYEKRGLVLARQGELERAEADFTRTIELDPDSAEAFHNRGVARMRLGREEEARADLEAGRRLEQARQRR